MSQRDDVLHMLEAAGEKGVTTGEFLDRRIPRFSARIDELRKTHVIVKHRVTASRFRYELVGVVEETTPVSSAPRGAGLELPVSSPEPPAGLFDDDGELAALPAMYRDAA